MPSNASPCKLLLVRACAHRDWPGPDLMIISDGGKLTLESEAPQSLLFIADLVLRHIALRDSKEEEEEDEEGGVCKKKKKKTISQFRGSARGEVIRTDI